MQNKIKKTLRNIIAYYSTSRRIGNTTLMMVGAYDQSEREPLVIVGDAKTARSIEKEWEMPQHYCLLVNQLEDVGFAGRQAPICFDNSALVVIFGQSLERITELEAECAGLKNTLAQERWQVEHGVHASVLNCLRAVLELDAKGFIHRDPLDTNEEFKAAHRAVVKSEHARLALQGAAR